jgi:predicted small secreted protein
LLNSVQVLDKRAMRRPLSFRNSNEGAIMVRKVITITLTTAALVVAGCNTVRGAAADVNSAANCTENAIHGGAC